MNKFKLNKNNNSKKLMIVVSILFCAVILIIGATIAFFTQSDSEDTGNIATININGTLLFDDNNEYMVGNFIPVEENHVLSFASKATDKCIYQDDMYACNMYEFTVTNNSNVTQELIFTLDVKENEFGNLYYNFLESSINDITTNSNYVKSKVYIDGTGEKEMLNNIVLGPKEHKTYTIIYYVKNLSNVDQTSMDANKKFYANVRVDSITTGSYTGTLMSAESCYTYELITEEDSEVYGELIDEVIGTYRLTSFKGIPNEGEIKTECGVTENNGLYSVTIPSKLKDGNGNELEVGALGNNLFYSVDASTMNLNKYSKINNIEIEEGIKVIDDGVQVSETFAYGTFMGVGVDSIDLSTLTITSEHDVNIILPSTLESIGSYAFMLTGNKKINFNDKTSNNVQLKDIGIAAFARSKIETITIPSSLKTIGVDAFYNSTINKLSFANDVTTIADGMFKKINIKNLEIPSNVKYIGKASFYNATIDNLTISGNVEGYDSGSAYDYSFRNTTINNLVFKEGVTMIDAGLFINANIISDKDNPLLIPKSVTEIGEYAFGCTDANNWNINLTRVIFEGSEDNTSNLTKIGEYAFSEAGLMYTNVDDPLIIPASVTTIGDYAFGKRYNPGDTKLNFIKYMGNRTAFDKLGTNWYDSSFTTSKPFEEYDNE